MSPPEIRPEDVAKYLPPRTTRWRGNPDVELCDEIVPISSVLNDFFDAAVPSGVVGSWKTFCPFADEHADGGADKQFRIYDTNQGWCFEQHGRLTPSRLIAIQREWGRVRAARWLLDHYGLRKRLNYRERFGEIAMLVEQRSRSSGNVQELAMVLREELASDPAFADVEFAENVRQQWRDCLAALDVLVARGADAEQLRRWYDVARARLQAAVLTAVQHTGYSEDGE